jgi:teichuronic acid biosynthesis glycosyltransferase TuaC
MPMNGIFIHQQAKALIELGHQCHVILTHKWFPPAGFHRFHPYWREGYNSKSEYFSEVDGVPVHAVPVFVKMPDRIFREDPYEREARAIVGYLKKNSDLGEFDWVISHFWTETSYVGKLVKEKLGVPLAAFSRGDDIHEWPKNNPVFYAHVQSVYNESDLLFANSKKLAEDAQLLVQEPDKRDINVIYNGVDLEKFTLVSQKEKEKLKTELGWGKDKIHILCVATPVKLKGWLELLDALSLLASSGIDFELIAVTVNRDFPDKIDIPSEASKRGIESHLRLLGQIPHDILPKIYKAADLFVLPSYNEGLANVALEAAATNLPMVLTDVGGHKEVFELANSVQLIPPKDTESLVKAIQIQLDRIANQESDSRFWVEKKVGDYFQNAKSLIEFLNE